jgi:hypothetical protein
MLSRSQRATGLLQVGALGAVGGAANASLCFAGLPVPVEGNPGFGWALIPGGALHGAALAIIPLAAALILSEHRIVVRLVVSAPLGWLAGYISWIPLHRWAIDETWSHSLVWPFQETSVASMVSSPFLYFGLVALIYFLALSLGGLHRAAVVHVAYAVSAGVLGSLWWWVDIQPWYFSLIHGTLWGSLVALGTYAATRRARAPRETRAG